MWGWLSDLWALVAPFPMKHLSSSWAVQAGKVHRNCAGECTLGIGEESGMLIVMGLLVGDGWSGILGATAN
jgi:hypothetical protein